MTPLSTQQPAVSDADDDEWPQSTPDSAIMEETNPAITPTNIHMWNTFHNEFV